MFARRFRMPTRSSQRFTRERFIGAAVLTLLIAAPVAAQDDEKLVRVNTPDEFDSNKLVVCDFSKDGEGKPLAIGDDVTRAYAAVGLVISGGDDSYTPVVQSYKVKDVPSAANIGEKGVYTGATVFTFGQSPDPMKGKAITEFGVWVSYITPKGTKLQAFDKDGELVGEIPTTKSGAEFLGFRSKVQIVKVRLEPVVDIDPDYAYDDVQFDPPQPIDW